MSYTFTEWSRIFGHGLLAIMIILFIVANICNVKGKKKSCVILFIVGLFFGISAVLPSGLEIKGHTVYLNLAKYRRDVISEINSVGGLRISYIENNKHFKNLTTLKDRIKDTYENDEEGSKATAFDYVAFNMFEKDINLLEAMQYMFTGDLSLVGYEKDIAVNVGASGVLNVTGDVKKVDINGTKCIGVGEYTFRWNDEIEKYMGKRVKAVIDFDYEMCSIPDKYINDCKIREIEIVDESESDSAEVITGGAIRGFEFEEDTEGDLEYDDEDGSSGSGGSDDEDMNIDSLNPQNLDGYYEDEE